MSQTADIEMHDVTLPDWTIDHVNAAIKDAVENGPRRVRRRIWVDPPTRRHWWTMQSETDGQFDAYFTEEESTAERILGGTGTNARTVKTNDPAEVLGALIAAHVRHGWTLESRTATEALLWREV